LDSKKILEWTNDDTISIEEIYRFCTSKTKVNIIIKSDYNYIFKDC
jgi:hypothetical protein